MLAINMDDVINVLNSCKPYLIALGIALAIAIIVTVACMKLKKPVKKLVRKEAWIAFLMAAVVIINLICFIPMSSMISLAMGNGTITEETSNEATALCEDIADEGIVLLKNEDNILPLTNTQNINVFGWASTNPCYGGTGSGALSDAYETTTLLGGLEDAGYKDADGDGYVEDPDGNPVELTFVYYDSRAELGVYAQAAQASLKEIGINIKLDCVSYETLLDRRDSSQYDLLIWNVLVANTGDPENYLRENWYSTSANNTAGYSNADVDAWLDELAETIDTEARKELIVKIQQAIMDDAATVFFGYENTFLISKSTVEGLVMYPMDYYWVTADMKLAE